MFLLRILGQGVTFITLIVLAKGLGPESFGQYAFIFGYLIFFTLIISFGINEIIIREISARRGDRDSILRTGMALKGLFSIIAIFLSIIGLSFIKTTPEVRIWGAVACLTLLTSFSFHSYRTILEVSFQADFRMEGPSFILLIARILFLIGLLGALSRGISLGTAIGLQLAAEAVGLLLLIRLTARRGYPVLPSWNGQIARYILSQGWPIAVAGIFVMVYTKINILFLQAFRGSEAVGFFAVSMRMVDALAIVPTVFMVAALPVFSRSYRINQERFNLWVKISFRLILAIILPITVITTLYAADIIEFFYGAEYAPSAKVLSIIIWAEIFVFGGLILDGTLVASNRQRMMTVLAASMAAASILLNSWWIPLYGIIGAAWATAVSYALGLIITLFLSKIRDIGVAFWREFPLPLGIAIF